MLNLGSIYWQNFLGTGNDGILVTLNTHRMTLSHGINGAGKSTLLDALFFALFGKPYRKIKLGQLVNSINKKACLVELHFSIGHVNYKIRRGLKPAIFEVFVDGVMQDQEGSNGDYQSNLETQILKTNFKSMSQIAVTGSANFTPFMKLVPAARREIIEDLLNIGIFSTMNTILAAKIKTNKAELIDIDHKINLCDQKIDMHKKYVDSLKKNNNEIIEEKEDKIKEYNDSIDQDILEVEELENQIKILKVTILDQEKVEKKYKDLTNCERGIEDNVRILTKDIKFFDNHDNCPTCTQSIDTTFKAKTIEEKNSELETLKGALVKLEDNINLANNRIHEINEQKEIIGTLRNRSQLKEQSINFTKRSIKQLTDEIEVLNVHNKNFEIDESELVKYKNEFNDLLEEKKVLMDNKETYNTSSSLLKDGGIKTQIIKQYIPIINDLINSYLAAMDFMVSFTLDENFEETIKSRYRDDFSYHSFSEGEKLRINLAILFAWRQIAKMRNSTNTNILIMDEILDGSLDAAGIEDFLRILNKLTNENVFIISHKNNEIIDKFDRTLEFQKVKSFSKMIDSSSKA